MVPPLGRANPRIPARMPERLIELGVVTAVTATTGVVSCGMDGISTLGAGVTTDAGIVGLGVIADDPPPMLSPPPADAYAEVSTKVLNDATDLELLS